MFTDSSTVEFDVGLKIFRIDCSRPRQFRVRVRRDQSNTRLSVKSDTAPKILMAMADTDSATATIDKLKQTLIFTYGTLKRDFPNYNLLNDLISQNQASYLGTYITHHPYPLVIGPHGIPFLINLPGAGHRVTGELYSVSTSGLGTVDELEGTNCGHYERLPIQVMKVKESDLDVKGRILMEAETYYANRSFGERLWEARGRVGLVEYSASDASGYVRREHRPKGSSFLGDIHLLLSKCSGQDV